MSSQAARRPAGAARRPQPEAAAGTDRLEGAFNRARRHSGYVRILKIFLPVLAVLMIVAFVARSYLAAPAGVSFDLANAAVEDGRLVMSGPKLNGFTSSNRPYSLYAARASQEIGKASIIELEEIEAKLPFKTENWVTVTAPRGVFNTSANTFDVTSRLTARSDTGASATLGSAFVDIDAGDLSTDDPVSISLDGATIEANSLEVEDRGRLLVFENRVRVVIDPQRLQTAQAGGATDEN
jgi:lipopolysaccharide export system protein LptC